jgi:hypothetical protein
MPSFNQPRDTGAEGVEGGLRPGFESDRSGQVDELVSPALMSETLIERAKTVVIVARRVDEDQAAQILLDAADKAHIPVSVAADQVMSALLQDGDDQGGITQDTLVQAIGCVRPLERDPGSGQAGTRVSARVSSQVSARAGDQGSTPLPTGSPAHQAA